MSLTVPRIIVCSPWRTLYCCCERTEQKHHVLDDIFYPFNCTPSWCYGERNVSIFMTLVNLKIRWNIWYLFEVQKVIRLYWIACDLNWLVFSSVLVLINTLRKYFGMYSNFWKLYSITLRNGNEQKLGNCLVTTT